MPVKFMLTVFSSKEANEMQVNIFARVEMVETLSLLVIADIKQRQHNQKEGWGPIVEERKKDIKHILFV